MIQEAPVAQSAAQNNATPARPKGGMLRCEGNRLGSDGSRTKARLAESVAEEAARRLGTLAILTAVTVVAMTALQHVLQPDLAGAHGTTLFRLSVLLLVLASCGLAILQRSKVVRPQTLLDLGLGFEVAGSFAIAAMENSMAWPDFAVRGSTIVAAWIAICLLVIPNRPWKSFTATLLSAFMVPLAHLFAANVLGYPPLPLNRLVSYSLGPFFIVGWTPFISARYYEMQSALSRSTDLGSYRLETLLGKGGMGEVWRAQHRLLRRDAAVKLVRPDLLATAGGSELRHMRERFELEAQAIASLRSPHTIAIYDFGSSEDGSLYYAMELLTGMDTQSLVNQYGPLPAGRVISILRQACDSLEEAHEAGMVHRDIKPSNLFVCKLGSQRDFVKVLDFGLVKAVLNPRQALLTIQNETSGTPAFMSPEQVRGEADVDVRADIYGLGCVAYFLLTGAMVFDEKTPMATAVAQVEQAPVPPSQRSELPIPASLERVVMTCLEKKRELRPGSASELVSLLEACTDIPNWTRSDAQEWWLLHDPAPAVEANA